MTQTLPHTPGELAGMIDHTLLKPDATPVQVARLCAEALEFGFATVCVNPVHVPLCREQLKGSRVLPCTVIGFPLGANTPAAKSYEAEDALQAGARELDMVLNIGRLKAGETGRVQDEIAALAHLSHTAGASLKVIIETCLLTNTEKELACQLAQAAGADFVKTSTGFSSGGATAEDIALMRRVVGPQMGVKASGGIRTLADALKMIEAGANRIGASASVAILQAALEMDWK